MNHSLAAVLLLLAVLLVGCSSELYHGLSEAEANDMIVVLEEAGIHASKEVDPSADGVWAVAVASGERADAWRVLRQHGLPRPEPTGFGAFYPSDGLVPTAGEERVLLQYATSQELRKGILTVDGVVDAHVNLVLPEKPRVRLSKAEPEPPRASVVVKIGGGEGNPITEEAVRDIVTGGVEGMVRDDVTVLISRMGAAPLGEPRYEQVGPISVAPSNHLMMQILMGGLVFLVMALAGAVVFLVVRR